MEQDRSHASNVPAIRAKVMSRALTSLNIKLSALLLDVDGAVTPISDFPMHLKKVESLRRILKLITFEEDRTKKK
uniref:Uncharacterized protein n=1 Tax=Lepeophtheirus salmonis TaxID=72036 RepID=A0A0K2UUD4_LEPSM